MTTTPLGRLAAFSYHHRRLVALGWLIVAAGLLVLGFTRGAPTTNDFSRGDSDSAQAAGLIATHFPDHQGSALTLAVQAGAGVRDPAVRARVATVLAMLREGPHVVAVTDPYQSPGHISPDGTAAFAEAALSVDGDSMPAAATLDLVHRIRAASTDGVSFALGGGAVDVVETPGGGPSDGIGVAAA